MFSSSSSPYRRCFGFIDPKPFLEMCQQDRACNAASLYIRHCRIQAVRNLRQPNRCQRCFINANGDNHVLLAGHKINRSIRKQKADIVFVVEERGCLRKSALQQLPKLVRDIGVKLAAADFNDARFSLLGFGNPEHRFGKAKSHWHTISGDISGDAEAMAAAIGGISLNKNAEWKSDPLDAVYSAVQHSQLRPDAAKHIVLISCSECHDARRTVRTVRAAVEAAGAHFHFITNKEIPTHFGRRSLAFGYDSMRTFATEAQEGSNELLQFTQRSAGKCAALATASGGSVFDLKFLSRPRFSLYATSSIRSFAQRLASTSAAEVHEECSCGSTSPMQPLRCRRQ